MTQPTLFDALSDLNRRQVLRGLLVGGAGVAAAGVLPGCTAKSGTGTTQAGEEASDTSASPIPGGTITWAKDEEATQLDPTSSQLGSSWELHHILYDTLVMVDGEFNIVPGLAESYESPSPTEYVFTLRQNAKFSNGRAMTADDVVGSFERILDPESGSALPGWVGTDTKVEKVDEGTVRFTLSKPLNTFLPALTQSSAAILPMKELEAGEIDLTRDVLGTGPFMVASHKTDREWVLKRNPHAWQEPVADTLLIKIIRDTNARIAALREGGADLSQFVEPDAPELLSSIPNLQVVEQDRTDYYFLQLNTEGPDTPFSDVRVRQAIAYGIDRDKIRAVALAGLGEVTGPVSAAFGDRTVPTTIERDVEKAKSLLEEAGASGLEFEIIYPGETNGNIAQVIQQDLTEIGVTVKATALEEGVWVERAWVANPAKMDATVAYYAAYAGPSMALVNWSPDLAGGFGIGFEPDDPKMTAVINQSWQATGETEMDAVAAAAQAVEEQAATIPLVTRPAIFAFRSDRMQAEFVAADGNIDPLHNVADFTRVKTA